MICTMLTDFGPTDSFVAQMKGALFNRVPKATVVDVTHQIPAGDILEGALLLPEYAFIYPKGTVHLAVVDPTVGTSRRALAISCRERWFIGPDNGLFTQIMTPEAQIYTLHQETGDLGATFHGRDIFTPAACEALMGTNLQQWTTGKITDPVRLKIPRARSSGGNVMGIIQRVDRFGNGVTNIPLHMVKNRLVRQTQIGKNVLKEISVAPPLVTFALAPPGTPALWFGSSGTLEIGIFQGHGARALGFSRGDTITLTVENP